MMRITTGRVAVSLAFAAFPVVSVWAVPIELSAAAFASATAGLPSTIENFEGFSAGVHGSPFALDNGVFTTSGGIPVISDASVFCGTSPDHCLISSDVGGDRAFSNLPLGTAFWATDLFTINSTNVFRVTVIGIDGASVFTHATTDSFWGFADAAGLLSVSFFNLGTGSSMANYSFDNVTTVSEPTTLALLGIGLAGLGFLRRQRKR
jgi:hypothetical protein